VETLGHTVLLLTCAAVVGVLGCTPTVSVDSLPSFESSPPPPTRSLAPAGSSNEAPDTAPAPSVAGSPPAPNAASPLDGSVAREADAGPVIREEKTVLVDGVTETWRLVWRKPPELICVDRYWRDMFCIGLAFGEVGDLVLVRLRPGSPPERLHLSPLFGPDGPESATLPRWDSEARRTALGEVAPHIDEIHPDVDAIKTLPIVDVMQLEDYDHDGRAAEFELPIVRNPFAWPKAAVVGISKRNPHLHAFDTVEHPGTPLLSPNWAAIKPGTNLFVEVHCGYRNATKEATRTISLVLVRTKPRRAKALQTI
jgi:hypothetical protein